MISPENTVKKILLIAFTFVFSAAWSQKTINALYLNTPPEIDGIFEPEKWLSADSATNFFQMEPMVGSPSTEKTTVFLGFDSHNIYVFFTCYQSAPVVAKNQSRDALSKNDDMVAVIFDTYNDKRSGYVFFTNPLGTQIDVKINDDGRSMDINWDAEWKCGVKVYPARWCAEFQIPFKSLKYKTGIENWGVNFGRIIRNNSETAYWSEALTEDFRISQGGMISGLKIPDKGMKITAFPYASLFKTTGGKWDTDAGMDVNWQISSNVSLNSTLNPDFATVEADQQRINLTRYELSYPEKRLFFQEGNDMYDTRIKTFYSRRIQDIGFGNRLNGKIGKTQFNILNVKTSEISPENPTALFTAAKLKFDVLKSSTLGLTVVDKSGQNGFTRSFSFDYVMNLGQFWKLTGQFVSSVPGDFRSHSAWYMRFARENNIFHYHFRYSSIGENFRENVNQTGFITDDDRKEIDFEGTYKFWIKNNLLEYISIGSNNNVFWSQTGTLRSWASDNDAVFYLKNRFSFEYSYNNEFKLFEKKFYNHRNAFQLGYNTDEWSHAIIGYTTGENFDRSFNLFSWGGRIKIFQNLSLSYSANKLSFTPDPNQNSTFINVFTANYNFTKDLWLKLFAQNDTKKETSTCTV